MSKNDSANIKITERKIRDRLDEAGYSISFAVPKDIESARRFSYDIVLKLASGYDSIMQINSGYAAPNNKNFIKNLTVQEYADIFKSHGIAYRYRKVPSTNTSILDKLFSGKTQKEAEELTAYIDFNTLSSEYFARILPLYGVRFFFAAEEMLLGDDPDRNKTIIRFMDLLDNEKLNLIEMAVFCYVYFGQIGISSIKTDYETLKKLLAPD